MKIAEQELLSIPGYSELRGIKRGTVWQAAKEGRLPVVRIGDRPFIVWSEEIAQKWSPRPRGKHHEKRLHVEYPISSEWIREVPGMVGYGASFDGRVFSRRITGLKETLRDSWRELSYQTDPKGYLRCQMREGVKSHVVTVHRVVAKTFIGEIPEGMTINHIDGNKADNTSKNLEIVTPQENLKHAHRIGLFDNAYSYAEANPHSKLSCDQVEYIKANHLTREKRQRYLAREFGVSQAAISLITTGKNRRRG